MKRSQKREAKLRVKKEILIFETKLRFAPLGSLRLAIFIKIQANN